MNREQAPESTLISCSRCDGPVRADELNEGTAVRVDGQPVCASCIEYLPQALRVQIQRVRALKGLATVTYRLQLPGQTSRNLFTFSNAGLMLLHRRALIHGTEFETPDLPQDGQQPAAPPPVSPRPSSPPWLILGAAAALLLLGVGVLVPIGRTPAPQPAAEPAPEPASAPVAVIPTAAPEPTAPPPPAPPVIPPADVAPATPLTAAAYVQSHANSYEALLAAEADAAPDELRSQLLALTRADRKRQLTRASQLLSANGSSIEAGEKILNGMSLPSDRSEFQELYELEQTLRAKIAFYRRQVTNEPPASPVIVSKTPAPTNSIQPPVATSPSPPVTSSATVAEPTSPPTAAKTTGNVAIFGGPLVNLTMYSLTDVQVGSMPSPWPTTELCDPLLFGRSNITKDNAGKVRHWCSFAIPAAQVAGGGINLLLHRNNASRKKLLLWRDDLPDLAPQTVALPTDQWHSVQLPIMETTSDTIKIRIQDSDDNITIPFWCGPVLTVTNAKPTTEVFGLMPPALLTVDVVRGARDSILTQLKDAAKERNAAKKWFQQAQMPTGEFQILCSDLTPAWKADLYEQIKLRWKKTRNENNSVDTFELANLENLLKTGGIPRSRLVVVLMPNGAENAYSVDEWTAKVRQISTTLIHGNQTKKITGGWLPVWIIGSTANGQPTNPALWAKIRAANIAPLIDLAPALGDQKLAARLVSDALQTLDFQLRWLQFTLANK